VESGQHGEDMSLPGIKPRCPARSVGGIAIEELRMVTIGRRPVWQEPKLRGGMIVVGLQSVAECGAGSVGNKFVSSFGRRGRAAEQYRTGRSKAKQCEVAEHSSEAVVRLLTRTTETIRNYVCIHSPHPTEWNATSHSYNCKVVQKRSGNRRN
jgi:hypothetical protein